MCVVAVRVYCESTQANKLFKQTIDRGRHIACGMKLLVAGVDRRHDGVTMYKRCMSVYSGRCAAHNALLGAAHSNSSSSSSDAKHVVVIMNSDTTRRRFQFREKSHSRGARRSWLVAVLDRPLTSSDWPPTEQHKAQHTHATNLNLVSDASSSLTRYMYSIILF